MGGLDHDDEEACDRLLYARGLVRLPIAKDGACLFRAVALAVYGAQQLHYKVREACVAEMVRQRDHYAPFLAFDSVFTSKVESLMEKERALQRDADEQGTDDTKGSDGSTTSNDQNKAKSDAGEEKKEKKEEEEEEELPEMYVKFNQYVTQLKKATFWGGEMELTALSAVYDVDFVIHSFHMEVPKTTNASSNRGGGNKKKGKKGGKGQRQAWKQDAHGAANLSGSPAKSSHNNNNNNPVPVLKTQALTTSHAKKVELCYWRGEHYDFIMPRTSFVQRAMAQQLVFDCLNNALRAANANKTATTNDAETAVSTLPHDHMTTEEEEEEDDNVSHDGEASATTTSGAPPSSSSSASSTTTEAAADAAMSPWPALEDVPQLSSMDGYGVVHSLDFHARTAVSLSNNAPRQQSTRPIRYRLLGIESWLQSLAERLADDEKLAQRLEEREHNALQAAFYAAEEARRRQGSGDDADDFDDDNDGFTIVSSRKRNRKNRRKGGEHEQRIDMKLLYAKQQMMKAKQAREKKRLMAKANKGILTEDEEAALLDIVLRASKDEAESLSGALPADLLAKSTRPDSSPPVDLSAAELFPSLQGSKPQSSAVAGGTPVASGWKKLFAPKEAKWNVEGVHYDGITFVDQTQRLRVAGESDMVERRREHSDDDDDEGVDRAAMWSWKEWLETRAKEDLESIQFGSVVGYDVDVGKRLRFTALPHAMFTFLDC